MKKITLLLEDDEESLEELLDQPGAVAIDIKTGLEIKPSVIRRTLHRLRKGKKKNDRKSKAKAKRLGKGD
jgi:hypothetical protein